LYPVQEHSLHSYDMVQISCSKYWYLNNHSQPKHFNQTSLLHSEIFSLFKYRGNFVVKILSLLQHRHRDSCSAPVCQVKICNFFASCRDEERITIKISHTKDPNIALSRRWWDKIASHIYFTFQNLVNLLSVPDKINPKQIQSKLRIHWSSNTHRNKTFTREKGRSFLKIEPDILLEKALITWSCKS